METYRIGEVRKLLKCTNYTIRKLVEKGNLTYQQKEPYADRLFPKAQVDRIKKIVDQRRNQS